MAKPQRAKGRQRRRVRKNIAVGQAHIKTGSLEGVRSIAGYVLDKTGRRWIVVFDATPSLQRIVPAHATRVLPPSPPEPLPAAPPAGVLRLDPKQPAQSESTNVSSCSCSACQA